jgi:hypothetical protein
MKSMDRRLPCQSILVVVFAFIAHGQDMPSDIRHISVYQEEISNLQPIEKLPDLLRLTIGPKVESTADWKRRREELIGQIEHYAYGHMPGRPTQVNVAEHLTDSMPNDIAGIEERMTLLIGSLKMRIALYRLKGTTGKLPVIIREEHALGHLEEVPQVLDRGYLFVEFAREDLDPDKPDTIGPAQRAYPNHDWGTLAVWAWGAMRVVDYLETRDDVDLTKVGITGHSRGGKVALLAGALDERFTLVAPNGSGCGGAGCYRLSEGKVETLELITRPGRFGYWFHPRLRAFVGQEEKLPFDQHTLKALVAPRALICTDALGDTWANPAGNRATSKAANAVFDFHGANHHNALHFREGEHDMTPADWKAILDFADWHFAEKEPENRERFFQY